MCTNFSCTEFLYENRIVMDQFLEDNERVVVSIEYFKGICDVTKEQIEEQTPNNVKLIERDFEVEMPKLLTFLKVQLKADYFLENKVDKYNPYKYTRVIFMFYQRFFTDRKIGYQMIDNSEEEVAKGQINEHEYIQQMNDCKTLKNLLDSSFVNTYMNAHYLSDLEYVDNKLCIVSAHKNRILSLLHQIQNTIDNEMLIVN